MLWAIVPAKLGGQAKQRLAAVLSPEQRRLLAEAMLRDVLVVLGAAERLDAVMVVGREQRTAELAEEAGALFLPEERATSLNEAVGEATVACRARGATAVLVAMGDLPLLRPDEIDRFLEALPAGGAIAAPSRDGTGTNLLATRPAGAVRPHFGPQSLAAHRASADADGWSLRTVEVPGASLDVDTPDDFARLVGGGQATGATARLLAALPTSSAPPLSHSKTDSPSPPWSR